MGRLLHLPAASRHGAQTAAASATTPDGITAAISTFLEDESVGRSLAAPAAPQPAPPANAPDAQRDPWVFPASEYPAGHPAGPPALSRPEVAANLPSAASPLWPNEIGRTGSPLAALAAGFDPRKNAPMPKPPWSARDHPPCFNWVRERDGCNGRHHLRDCPLPRARSSLSRSHF